MTNKKLCSCGVESNVIIVGITGTHTQALMGIMKILNK